MTNPVAGPTAAMVVVALVAGVTACAPPESHRPEPRDAVLADVGPHADLLALAMGWEQQIPAPPRTPIYFYVWFDIDDAYWNAQGWCPVLETLEVRLDGEPIDRDPEAYSTRGCDPLSFRLTVEGRLDDFADRETLTVVASDGISEVRYEFENTLRPPVISLAGPISGIARRGDVLTFEVLPSVAAEDSLDVLGVLVVWDPGTIPGVDWGSALMQDVAVDSTHFQWTVPAAAYIGESTVDFNYSESFGNYHSGWGGATIECTGVRSCETHRTECESGFGCGPMGMPAGPLDRPEVPISIVQ